MLASMLRITVLTWSLQVGSIDVAVTNGVPDDLLPFFPESISPDFGMYSQCEVARGSGLVSGICVPPSYLSNKMPFCGEVVSYPTCVPPRNQWWPSWDVSAKDSIVGSLFSEIVRQRLQAEKDSMETGGTSDYVPVFFTGNEGCISSFKKVVCAYNFPRCDYFGFSSDGSDSSTVGTGDSIDIPLFNSEIYPICRESCEAYFAACRINSEMTSQFCESSIESFWPLVTGQTGSLNLSSPSIVLASLTQGSKCTGNGVTLNFSLLLVFLLIYVSS